MNKEKLSDILVDKVVFYIRAAGHHLLWDGVPEFVRHMRANSNNSLTSKLLPKPNNQPVWCCETSNNTDKMTADKDNNNDDSGDVWQWNIYGAWSCCIVCCANVLTRLTMLFSEGGLSLWRCISTWEYTSDEYPKLWNRHAFRFSRQFCFFQQILAVWNAV